MSTQVSADRRFFFIMAVISAVLVFAGFSPSYYLKQVFHAPPPLSAMSGVHGFVFSAWVLVFVLQAGLVRFNNPALHRQLGLIAAVLFGVVLTVGVMTGINAGRVGNAPPGSPPPLVFMVVPLSAMVGAAIMMGAALWDRTRRDFHMRYCLAAFISMTPPATHRIFIGMGYPEQALWFSLAVADVLLAAALVYDVRSRNSVHPANVWSMVVYAAMQGGIVWCYANQSSWMPVANWLTQT